MASETVTYTMAEYGPPTGPWVLRTYVPLEESRGSVLRIKITQSVLRTPFQLQGVQILYRTTSQEAGF